MSGSVDGSAPPRMSRGRARPTTPLRFPLMYHFDAELWLHDSEGGWCFLTVPAKVSDDISARTVGTRRGFGSVRVRVTIGATTWATSVFPDSKRSAYLLPVKKQARTRERIEPGDVVGVALELVEG